MAKISSPSLVDTGQDPGLQYLNIDKPNNNDHVEKNSLELTGRPPTSDVANKWLYEAAISAPSIIDKATGVAVTPTRPTKSSTSGSPSYIIGPGGNVRYVTEVVNNFINNFIPPAGHTHEIQINENGALYADPQLTFNPITDTLTTETVNAKYVSGGLLTNAQPNITSIGTLDHLNVTDSVVANGFYYSNGMPIGGVIGDFNRGVYFGAERISNNVSLVDTFPLNGNTAVRWTTSSFDAINAKYKTSTIDSLNDGANIYHNEYSVIRTDETAAVIQFTSNISLGNINLWAVGDSPQVQVTFERTVLGSSTNIGYLTAGPRGERGLPGNGSWNGGVVTNLIRVTNTTNSISTNTGAVVISGGLGVVGNVNVKNISANGFYYANGTSIVPDLTTYASKAYVNTAISSNLANYTTKSYVDGKLANVTWANLAGKPTLANIATSGSYLDLTNTPTIPSLAGYATENYVIDSIRNISVSNIGDLASTGFVTNAIANVTWANLSGKPTFANVATTGSYLDLTNKPSIPSLTGYATESYVGNAIANISIPNTDWPNIANKPAFFDGSYTSLTNKPSIPTHTSNLTNNSGFITISDVPNAKELSFDIKSTNFSADSGARYGIDTTSGPVTCTLPSSPTTGDAILFVDVGVSFGTFGFTLDGNNNDIRYVVNDASNSEPTLVVANSYTIEKSDYLAGSLGPRSWGILWTGSVWTGY